MQIDCYGFKATSQFFKRKELDAHLMKRIDGVREVRFLGYGTVTSLFGSYEEPAPAGFIDGEEVAGSDGKITLNAAQAKWLNKFNDHEALKSRIAAFSKDGFDEAYLLNLDIREDDCSKVFKVSAINVKKNSVEITVTLVRAGAVQEGGKDAPINGVLKFHGADTLGGFTHISSKALAGFDDKIESGEVKVEFPKNIDGVDCKFFKATIEEE